MSRQLVLHSGALADMQAVIGSGDTELLERLAAELPSGTPQQSAILETARQVILQGIIYAPDQQVGHINTVLGAVATVLPHFSPLTSGFQLGAYWYLRHLVAQHPLPGIVTHSLMGHAASREQREPARQLRDHLDALVGGRSIVPPGEVAAANGGAICGYIATMELPSFLPALRRVIDHDAEPTLASQIDQANLRHLVEWTRSAAAKAARDELDLFAFCL